ncbi:MAG: prepilin-type N-terminal cleavage/methylation domain-containing protein [Deltaproteobacteria bacterium]|jgi:prepilin-type N-terminal cleavage/methylation domain-containing protein|nr:prepilin-type N-terminal cleavage/methylation domain-containing protein [Deltaproteobacteria bacterium]
MAGFTLMEVLVVIVIIAIMAAVAYPLMRGYKPDLTVRGGVRQIDGVMRKARLRAANQNRPTRVVINCSRPGGFDSCFIDLQAAIFQDADITDWDRNPSDHLVLDKKLAVVKPVNNVAHDGKVSLKGIYWAIFMPAGQVFSDPRPLNLFIYHDSQKKELKKGWKIKVNNETGRVETTRDTLSAPAGPQ